MNKSNIDWKNWKKNFQKENSEIGLKNSKSGSIAFLKDKNELINWKIYHTHWEDWVSSSDYWKNWREKINGFQTIKEVDFYTDRLRAFVDFVKEYTRKDIRYVEGAKLWDPINTPKLIEQELKRLENISEEEFKKTDKWSNSTEFKELSTEEILNDPWFNKEIDKFFGLNGKSNDEINVVYTNGKKNDELTKKLLETLKEQVISDSNAVKANEHLTSSEKQEKLLKNQQRLQQLNNSLANYNSVNSNSLPSFFIGGTILSIIGLFSFLVIRKHRKNK